MQDALKGIKVLDLTMNLPGPFMTWIMAEMGAEVLKVENPEIGDFARTFNDPEQELYFPVFDTVNRRKKSITLDLKQQADQDIFLGLIEDYTIVVEGFRPGVLKKLGIDYETVVQQYPEVIYVSISGYGQDGSYAHKGGHDLNYQALAGCFDTGSMAGITPSVPAVTMADIGGGSLFALSGLLSAIIARTNTGKGRHIDMSIFDGIFLFNIFPFCQMKKNSVQNRDEPHIFSGNHPFYNIYETLDNRHMSLGALEEKFWQTFCRTIGREDLFSMRFGGKKAIQEVAAVFKSRTQADWIELFRNKDACCEPVLSIKEVMNSGLCTERDLVRMDETGIAVLNNPVKTVGEPPGEIHKAPALGRHNPEILGNLSMTKHP
ncbi:Crotonobetainyl-CoA:carnitine CoA-transferase CaiB [Desulfocicer vacuolatum DSM 3385]|uniref:Crotonobetainyl-CoA:carnitine CoA-transferase CaiB n=1 Tax=Desulfocicer vacuolatum DSM 3385 TaxID=1121400 RepID=A0A1W2EJB3_9BACT|nr:CaiB/BaiF CoA-transferase family protein [Desulfocicer vacuolatum]SMD09764.1 Crotonobetainyl-CoA:carnitine CoA-transferase CaiB [Desulfocicer vacuolatum DSM 3385]